MLRVRVVSAVLTVLMALVLWAAPGGAAPAQQPEGCGAGPAGENQVYLGAWIPAAHDDPRMGRGADPLGQFEAKAGKGVSILQRWEHWGLGSGGRIDTKWLRRVARGRGATR